MIIFTKIHRLSKTLKESIALFFTLSLGLLHDILCNVMHRFVFKNQQIICLLEGWVRQETVSKSTTIFFFIIFIIICLFVMQQLSFILEGLASTINNNTLTTMYSDTMYLLKVQTDILYQNMFINIFFSYFSQRDYSSFFCFQFREEEV